ncbi:DUF6506 family protein [Asanoa siamensis]|uniref:Uncharacterized protein n=1 Tax=Asanoa siamensis TaxID=926357 RepID=A0ABQ4CYW3_9ACTN|nr:DUF6506 family protein [Asanoa siamensis]GIF76446.1 hypothetical protein Asi02nite_59640 [Asanoa siamensis]
MSQSWAYVYEHPGSDPSVDRHVVEGGGQRTVLVAVPDAGTAVEVARALVDDGVGLIELCGGFSTAAVAEVVRAVGDRVPVGHVTFSVENVPGAAAYSAAFTAEQGSGRR